jgi:alcohol dehydrogenase class IV
MLPHVMRWNRDATAAAQRRIAQALGAADGDAADAVGALIASLGLPTRLRDLDVSRDAFGAVVAAAMQNLWVRTNPRPVRGPDDVTALLEAAW